MIPGDQARAAVTIAVEQAEAFRIFTEEIDRWWRRGVRYRVGGRRRGFIHLEAKLGGRLFESFDHPSGARVVETGRVTAWEPPARLAFEWRSVTFEPAEKTEVEVTFKAQSTGTLVTVTHRGWAAIRGDHPVRHGADVPAFIRSKGMWWGDLLTSLRLCAEGGAIAMRSETGGPS